MRNVRRPLLTLLVVSVTAPAQAQSPPDVRPELLKALDGRWVMTGDVMRKPVTYDLESGPVLAAAFTELHMKDVQVPAEYEARVFLGWDDASKTVIVHWLDSFGGRYSIPHGTGRIDGTSIVFTIAYPDGPFRDMLTYDPAAQAWSFLIEAGQKDGSWQHFAAYQIRRRPAP
jgi:hypothetical protein